MNRNCNIEELAYESQGGGKILRWSDLQDWLSDKKVIKKGLQPHPYADVLHEWAEGVEIEHKHIGSDEDAWMLFNDSKYYEYRIKPQEPVHEWQWVVQEKEGGEFFVPQGWHTFEELKPQVWSLVRLEETKRVRQ